MRKEVMRIESQQKKRSKPITFADYFKVDENKLKELGTFNPILNFDTKLFVEPLLLKKSQSEIIRNAYSNYHDFFSNALMLLISSNGDEDKCFKAVRKMLKFPEYKSTCLGYGGDNINGSGSGSELNEKILQSAKEIAEKAKQNPAVLPFLALLEEGIGADRISDMVQNIIDEDICKYTLDIMQKIGLKGEYEYIQNEVSYLLPLNIYSNCPIKLLPKDILSNLPLAENFDDWILKSIDFNENLRDRVNKDFGVKWQEATKKHKKETLREKLKTDKEFFIFVLEALSEAELEHYDLEKDYEGLYRWLKDSERFSKLNTFNAPKILDDNLDLIFFEVEKIILYFAKSIEENEFWRLFWTETLENKRHVKEFYSQMMFFSICETWLIANESNLKITREFDKETKQIELSFSVSGKNKVIVRVKHSNNKELENGYDKHIDYLKNANLQKSFFVVMNFAESENPQLKAIKSNKKEICKIISIDVAPQNNCQMLELGSNLIEFEGNFEGKYIEEKRKGGQNSYKNHKPLKEKVEELCREALGGKKKVLSALQLTNIIACKMEKEDLALLNQFKLYQDFKNGSGVDWTKPTFYKWCNEIFRSK